MRTKRWWQTPRCVPATGAGALSAPGLRSPATRDALTPQDGLYALNVRGETDNYAIIGSIARVLVAPGDPAVLLAAMAL